MVDVIELKALACADCGETAIVKQWSDRAKATALSGVWTKPNS
jgi:hypothetical protein